MLIPARGAFRNPPTSSHWVRGAPTALTPSLRCASSKHHGRTVDLWPRPEPESPWISEAKKEEHHCCYSPPNAPSMVLAVFDATEICTVACCALSRLLGGKAKSRRISPGLRPCHDHLVFHWSSLLRAGESNDCNPPRTK